MERSPEDFAREAGVTEAELAEYEKGERDFSFSFLYRAAEILGVDVVDLMSGESPTLSTCCLVRAGGGLAVDRRAAYQYAHLAHTFRRKSAEPFLVTVEPKDETPVLHSHAGQEFNYLLSGQMRFFINTLSYDLSPGDSVYFDSGAAHAMRALGGEPAVFLAVVMKGGAEHAAV
jgi:quercetin dioxygenase-like cupin family protein